MISARATLGPVCSASAPPVLGTELLVHTESPPNAEPRPDDLVRSWITPTKYFYVRSHATTPTIDVSSFRVQITGLVDNECRMSVSELIHRFPNHTTTATMVCAGNRRQEHSVTKLVEGVQWGVCPVGNAEWSGVRLSDVLRNAGIREGAKHVWFESVDSVTKNNRTFAFGASIPLDKALDDSDGIPGTLLANCMNGEILQPDHGFPVRAVVPGYIGARSVKWLGKIVVSDRPNPNYFMSVAYKVAQERDDKLRSIDPIYEFPINSAICTTGRAHSSQVHVTGYALPVGDAGRIVTKVELSSDGGQSWTEAHFCQEPHEFCWRLWEATVPISNRTSELIVRASDSSGLIQPETVNWNFGGYLYNAWHHVSLNMQREK